MAPTMTGKPRPPVAFGDYEVGRSKKPVNQKPTAAFKDGMKKGLELEPQGDPGAYDPYTNSDLVASASFTHNKTSKPFMATSTRDLAMQLYGEDAPGPGAYQAAESQKKQYPAVDPNISVFRSGSLQRPKNDTPVPGSGTYSPNLKSIYANQRDSGAQMRSAGGRFREDQSMTEPIVGPGSYDQLDGSLYIDAQSAAADVWIPGQLLREAACCLALVPMALSQTSPDRSPVYAQSRCPRPRRSDQPSTRPARSARSPFSRRTRRGRARKHTAVAAATGTTTWPHHRCTVCVWLIISYVAPEWRRSLACVCASRYEPLEPRVNKNLSRKN